MMDTYLLLNNALGLSQPAPNQEATSLSLIDDRFWVEETLRVSPDLMRYIIEHNLNTVAILDKDLNFIYVSQRYLDEYLVKDKEVIGKHYYDVFPDIPQNWRDIHQKVLSGKVCNGEDDPHKFQNGTIDWIRWLCHPWFGSDDSIGGIIVYIEVITESIQIEEKLRQRNFHLEIQLEAKTRELWERVVELEQFFDATVEREFRIKEMREEIERLNALVVAG